MRYIYIYSNVINNTHRVLVNKSTMEKNKNNQRKTNNARQTKKRKEKCMAVWNK